MFFIRRFYNNKKLVKVAIWIGASWLILVTSIFIVYPWIKADGLYLNSRYSGKISKIEYRPGHRGSPYLKIGNEWHLINAEELKIIPYLQEGDSVVKEIGSRKIVVYRSDGNRGQIRSEFD